MTGQPAHTTRRGRPGEVPAQPPQPGKALSVFILLVGLGIVGVGAYSFVQDTASLDNTVEVDAEITGLDVERTTGSRGRRAYVPIVTYQYQFEGTEYTSDRIYPGIAQPRYEEQSTAAAVVEKYSLGQQVTAYVDPAEPGEAFLENARSGQASGAFFVGVGISLISGGWLVLLWIRRRKDPTDD